MGQADPGHINRKPAVIAVNLAEQTGDNMQYVADLMDIATPQPQRRQLDNPEAVAALLSRETIARVEAVCGVQAGDPIVLLSGGVDSILVAVAAVKAGYWPRAITVTTAEGTDQDNATAAAKALGLAHHIVAVDECAVVELARESVARLGLPELWEVSYAISLLAAKQALDRLDSVGPILTGNAADAIFAGGSVLTYPVGSPEAIEELDRLIRKKSASNFRYRRLVPDFHERVIPEYASRFVHIFQTVRFWTLAEQLAPSALFGNPHGAPADKLCVRLACRQLLPESASGLAWAKKSAIQKSAGIIGSLAAAARYRAADLPGARTYTDPETESWQAVATRLYLALLAT
jgi:asparagine synthase (glutamine-hydrolysing)